MLVGPVCFEEEQRPWRGTPQRVVLRHCLLLIRIEAILAQEMELEARAPGGEDDLGRDSTFCASPLEHGTAEYQRRRPKQRLNILYVLCLARFTDTRTHRQRERDRGLT